MFATVQADNEDLKDGDPYLFYKGSGAVSSDIDLYFNGEGFLSITSKNKEGVETKGNLSFDGGTGDYEIYAQDDCLNTTTASQSGATVRNDMTINVASLLAKVDADADEGDAIDSNGKLVIEGGKIQAYAHPTSGDAGLDSGKGTYINGGVVIATGNMVDAISSESQQKYFYASLNTQVKAGSIVSIRNSDDKVIYEFEAENALKTVLYSDADLSGDSYKVYVDGEEVSYSSNEMGAGFDMKEPNDRTNKTSVSDTLLKVWIGEIAALLVFVVIIAITHKAKR